MSHQTGISPNEELSELFAASGQSEKIRFISVVIQDEKLCCGGSEKVKKSSWESDWTDAIMKKYFKESTPSYGFFRKSSDEWILISWSPDSSSVRSKMLYASTKATLKTRFGSGRIVNELFATLPSELTLEGLQRHLLADSSPGPLSNEEKEREEVKMATARSGEGINARTETMKGLVFPLSKSLKEGLTQSEVNYLQISIDTEKEVFNLQCLEKELSLLDLPKRVPKEEPRYHLFRFKHTHEGEYKESHVFIYTMPGYNCTIKERMLYSSCNNSIVDVIQSMDIPIVKKIQVESGDELTEEFLLDELYPKQNINKQKFARPPPPSRGRRRITKAPVST
eukprot:TRINITY_DN2079_c0_g4_i2.p1 TRINITY_DN2079_c0_g4~~TRINITY_DN2079_c0_g4_i2.p1  ORF type:complete len:339 (-),score=88.63 TRINITY_DN2079_c0_g4_i2:159-1175(-)